MELLECFGNVVGLTHDDESDSGLYITDLEAVATIEGIPSDVLQDARRVAILALNADLIAMLSDYAYVRKPYSGRIGTTRWHTRSSRGSSLMLLCKPLENATMTINQIGALFRTTGEHNVVFTSNIGHSQTFTIDCTADTLSVLDLTAGDSEPLSLPLYSDIQEAVIYRFTHQQSHLVSKLYSCGGCSFKFSLSRPRFSDHGMTQYIQLAAYDGAKYLNNSAGLVLSGNIRCRVDNIICDDALDFTHDSRAQLYAQAIQYKAGSVVVWNCLRNPILHRATMEDAGDLREAAKYYERKYRDLVAYISAHAQYTHDCICEKRRGWIGRTRH